MTIAPETLAQLSRMEEARRQIQRQLKLIGEATRPADAWFWSAIARRLLH